MITSDACDIGNHDLCNDQNCECGCHSSLIRSSADKMVEDRAYMEGLPGPE